MTHCPSAIGPLARQFAGFLALGVLICAASVQAADPELVGKPKRGREAMQVAYAAASQPSTTMVATPSDDQTIRMDLGAGTGTRLLSIPRGKSAGIDLPVDATDVLVSDPKVAQVALTTRRRIFILGLASGQTDAAFYDGSGRQLLRLNVRVDQDTTALAQTLNKLLPGSGVRVDAVNDNIILSGVAPDASTAEKAVKLAASFVARPENVVNMMSVAGRDQVMIKVRVVEVNRTVIKQLGFNLSAVAGQAGLNQLVLGVASTFGVNGSLQGGLNSGYKLDTTMQPEVSIPCISNTSGSCQQVQHGAVGTYVLNGQTYTYSNGNTAVPTATAGSNGVNSASAMLQAFESAGLVRTLAEPTLTAISGESAQFLAGGEFPVPTGSDTTGTISISFKQYGVGLGFTPIVLGPGRISLKVSTEVSELAKNSGFTLQSASTSTSVVIPGLNVRRVSTTVELPSGGAMMLAGLLQNTTSQTLAGLPGLLQLPVLGPLFRSRDFLNNESELVIIITPYIVKSVSPDQLSTPADGLVIPSDMETDLLGKLNKASGKALPSSASKTSYQGPFGYVVD